MRGEGGRQRRMTVGEGEMRNREEEMRYGRG